MAVKYWDYKKNVVIYDEDIYEENSDTWVRDFSYPEKLIPSAQESFEEFLDEHLSVVEDKKTGYVSLSIKHQSPFIAKQWVEVIFNEINAFYRQKDKAESEKAIAYLRKELAKMTFSEIKQVTASLIQQEIQKLTLIEANTDYVFEYINPPSVMEEHIEPRRYLIIILFTLFGGLLGATIVLFRYFFNK